MSKTNPLGAGTENLSINVPKALKRALEQLAKESDEMKLGAYCRRVLEEAKKNKVRFKVVVAGGDSAKL